MRLVREFLWQTFWVILKLNLSRLKLIKKQDQEVVLVKDFPLVTETSLEVYAKEVADLLVEIQAFQQPILVLFTAKDMLLAVSDLLPVSHLAQYKKW